MEYSEVQRIQLYKRQQGKTSPGHHLSIFPGTQEHGGLRLLSGGLWGNGNLPSSGSDRPLGTKQPSSLSPSPLAGLRGPDPGLRLQPPSGGDTLGRNNKTVAAALPLTVAAVEVDEIAVLDALGAGQPPAGGVAQRTPLDRHVQPLRVVHRVH